MRKYDKTAEYKIDKIISEAATSQRTKAIAVGYSGEQHPIVIAAQGE